MATFWIIFGIIAGTIFIVWRVGVRRGWWAEYVPPPVPPPDPDPPPGPDPPPPTPTADLTVIFVHETGKRTWRQWLVMGGVKRYCRQSDKLDCIVLDDDAKNEKGQRMYVDLVEAIDARTLPCMAIVQRNGSAIYAAMPKTKAKAVEIIRANGG